MKEPRTCAGFLASQLNRQDLESVGHVADEGGPQME
jgi:hypothetical protein